MMVTGTFSSRVLPLSNVVKKFYSKQVLGHHACMFYNGTNSTHKNSCGHLLVAKNCQLQRIAKLTQVKTVRATWMQQFLKKNQPSLKHCSMVWPVRLNYFSYNFLVYQHSKSGKSFFHSFWMTQFIAFLFVVYYYSKRQIVEASSRNLLIAYMIERDRREQCKLEEKQNQENSMSQNVFNEANQDHVSPPNKDEASNNESFSEIKCNAGQENQFSEDLNENYGNSQVASSEAGNEEFNMFAPLIIDELQVSNPVELNDAQSMTHHHLVMQSAAVALESSLLLLLRVSRAQMAIMETYKRELENMLQLLQYEAEVLRNCAGAAYHSHVLQQLTSALVEARARVLNLEQQYKDGCLLMRVAHQSSDSAQLCAHMAGAEQDALAVASVIAALRPKIEEMQHEITNLKLEVRAQQVEVIRSEKEGREAVKPADVTAE